MPDTSKCRDCEQVIFWHVSKGGKKYPCDSDNRRDFHQCTGMPPQKPLQPQTMAPHAAPIALEASLAERVSSLEVSLAGIAKVVRKLQASLPITDEDIPF